MRACAIYWQSLTNAIAHTKDVSNTSLPSNLIILVLPNSFHDSGWVIAKFYHRRSHHVSPHDQQAVSNPDLFLPRNLINHASKQKVSGPHFMCLINHVSSHNQQSVSVSASFICQEVSSIMSYPTTNRKWVTLLPVFARQSCQSIMSHPMTNSKWVTLFHLFPRQSHQSCLIPWPTAGGWHCFMHSCQAVSSIMLHPMTNSKWVKLLQSRYGLLKYAYLIRRTGPVISYLAI